MKNVIASYVVAAVLAVAAGAADAGRNLRDADSQLQLYWDNGTPGTEFNFYTGVNSWVANDFNISTLASYNYLVSASACQYSSGWPNGNWNGNLLAIFGFSGTPGSILWGPVYVRGSGSGGWQTYPIGWSLGSVQSFAVAFSQLYNYPNADSFTLDTGSNGGHSWYYYAGVWAHISSLGYGNHALMVRCTVDDSHGNAVAPASLGRVKALYH